MTELRRRRGRPLYARLALSVALVGSALAAADLVTAGADGSFVLLSAVNTFGWGALLLSARAGARHERQNRRGPWRWAAEWRDRRQSLAPVRCMSRVAELVAGGDSASFVVLDVARALVELLGLRDCRYEPGVGSGLRPALRHGELTLYGLSWSALDRGLPSGGFELAVVARGQLEGRFVCLPQRGRRPVAEDRLLAASALVDQVASAQLIERVA